MTQARTCLTFTLLGLALLVSHAAFAQESKSDVDAGKALYDSFQCWQCHGYEGQGGRSGSRIVPVDPYIVFSTFVRYTDLMPAYSPAELSDAQLKQIYEFVRSIPAPPPLEEVSRMGLE
jgi:mono/diheme cytochrome c family protein